MFRSIACDMFRAIACEQNYLMDYNRRHLKNIHWHETCVNSTHFYIGNTWVAFNCELSLEDTPQHFFNIYLTLDPCIYNVVQRYDQHSTAHFSDIHCTTIIWVVFHQIHGQHVCTINTVPLTLELCWCLTEWLLTISTTTTTTTKILTKI